MGEAPEDREEVGSQVREQAPEAEEEEVNDWCILSAIIGFLAGLMTMIVIITYGNPKE